MTIVFKILEAKHGQAFGDYADSKDVSLYFVNKGALFIDVALEKRRVSAGNMFFVGAGLIHKAVAGNHGTNTLMISVPQRIWQKHCLKKFEFMNFTPSPLLRELTLSQRSPWPKKLRHVLSDAFLQLLSKTLSDQCTPSPGLFRPLEHYLRTNLDNRVAKALTILTNQETTDDLGVLTLAKRAHISERQLHRLFVQQLGITPVFALRQAKVERAMRLLRSSSLSISEIAFAAGFSSLAQFNASFRDIARRTPSNYRHS